MAKTAWSPTAAPISTASSRSWSSSPAIRCRISPRPSRRYAGSCSCTPARAGDRASLPREGPHEGFGLFGCDQPGAVVAALDPDQAIDARHVHLNDSAPLGPQPSEAAPQASGTNAQTPAGFAPQRRPVDETHARDASPRDLAALERPDHLEHSGLHYEAPGTEPQPDPHVEREEEECRSLEH